MDIDKLLVKIDNLKKLQDDIDYEISQEVAKAKMISEMLYSISYSDDAPMELSEFMLDNEIDTLDDFDLESYIHWERYEEALNELQYKFECIDTIINNK
jgi:hypothetical protein